MTEVALEGRRKVERIEDEIAKLPQAEVRIRHYFAPGLYAREMTIPANVMLTGAVHKTEHLSTVSAGRILVFDGVSPPVEIRASHTFISQPGAKRFGIALEETVWTTYHPTNTTDLDALCEELTESTTAELLGGARNKQLLMQKQESLK
jgi:hypothetical protein